MHPRMTFPRRPHTLRGPTFAAAMVALVGIDGSADAQLFRPMDRIPEPTVQDVDPGQTAGSPDALPYEFRRQPVYFRSNEAPGTIIIDTSERFLYLIQSPTNAMRYGIGVG